MEPVASTFKTHSALAITSIVFSPRTIRHLPKALPRTGKQNNKHETKSAVLEDTLVKDEIATIEASKNVRKVKSSFLTTIRKKKKNGKANK